MSLCACQQAEAIMQGVCRACWAAKLGTASRVYFWTPALRTELKLAYARPKRERTAAITALQQKTKWPRHALKVEAQRLGITFHRRSWTRADDQTLRAALGELSVRQIAAMLNRTHESVKARAERMRLSVRIREGFCIADLVQILGMPRYRVHELIEKGMFGAAEEIPGAGIRVKDDSLTGFIRRNPELIDFRFADQTFIKGVLYGSG